ncbi:hypothetical protein A9Q81_23255 [Gammaproteobacteria bacterium 42_54_T18]|nr:hypothetical protein A9Q81_23255 [Gammaproteobacteria bacterium 42_54_T18]
MMRKIIIKAVNILTKVFIPTLFFIASFEVFAGGGGPPKPTTSAEKIRFTFTADSSPAKIMPIRRLEGVQIWPAKDETNITHYNVYWGDSERNKLGLALAPKLAHIAAKNDGKVLEYEFNSLKMEAGAIWMLVCTENDGKEYCGKDNNLEKIVDPLLAINRTLTDIKSLLSSNNESTCSGFDVMATCGNNTCDGIETADSCPSDCGPWGLASFNFQTLCDDVKNAYHPTSVSEIQQIINDAAANNQHVKVNGGAGANVTTGSASSVVCTDGVVIQMDKFDHNQPGLGMSLEVFEGKEVVNVAAGTRLSELGDWLYERGRGIGYAHLGWADPTVAGAIGTSAHGSSATSNNVISHRVISLDVIDPQGQLKTYSRGTTGENGTDLWKAMTTHLGYLGVITRARIEIEDAKNVHVKITFHEEKELFEENAGSVWDDIKDCDYGQYNWFPSQNRYLKTCGKTTTEASDPGANNKLLLPYVDLSQLNEQQTMQIFQLGGCQPNSGAHDKMAYMRVNGWHLTPPLVRDIDGEQRYTTNAIGPIHKMTSSHLIALSREMFQMDWEVAVPAKNIQAAMEYVRDFTNGINAKNRKIPVPLIGIFVRFSKSENESLMAYSGSGGPFEDGTHVAHIEMPIFVPVNLTDAEFAEYMGPYEEAQKILIEQFGARGHWGKNQHSMDTWLFELQKTAGSYDHDNRLQRFSNEVGQFDPNGMFANPFAKAMGISYPNFTYPSDW